MTPFPFSFPATLSCFFVFCQGCFRSHYFIFCQCCLPQPLFVFAADAASAATILFPAMLLAQPLFCVLSCCFRSRYFVFHYVAPTATILLLTCFFVFCQGYFRSHYFTCCQCCLPQPLFVFAADAASAATLLFPAMLLEQPLFCVQSCCFRSRYFVFRYVAPTTTILIHLTAFLFSAKAASAATILFPAMLLAQPLFCVLSCCFRSRYFVFRYVAPTATVLSPALLLLQPLCCFCHDFVPCHAASAAASCFLPMLLPQPLFYFL